MCKAVWTSSRNGLEIGLDLGCASRLVNPGVVFVCVCVCVCAYIHTHNFVSLSMSHLTCQQHDLAVFSIWLGKAVS